MRLPVRSLILAFTVLPLFGQQVINAGGGGTSGSVANSPSPSSAYTFYPATASNCSTYSATGTNYCAVNNNTGAVSTSTDIRALWDTVSAATPNGGTFFFKNGTYNCNTLDQESTGGFTNFYCIGLPGNVAANQFASWSLRGEGMPVVVGGSPVQTTGAIIALTSTGVSSVAAHSKIMVLWARPGSGTGVVGPMVNLYDLGIRVPTNQRGCETESDLTQAVNAEYTNIETDTAVTPASLAFPVEDTCTAWGLTDRGGLVGVTTTKSSQQQQYLNNVNTWGCDECIDVQSEHTVMVDVGAASCNYGIEYGVHGGNIYHQSTFIGSGWSECARGFTAGTNIQNGATLDMWDTDVEEATASFLPAFQPVYRAAEATPGNLYGHITYTVVTGGVGTVQLASPSLFDGGNGALSGGGGNNMLQYSRGLNSLVTPQVAFTDNFNRPNSLNNPGGQYTADGNIGVNTNALALSASNTSSRAVYRALNFSTDQFSKATFTAMDVSATTYSEVEVNGQGAVGSSHQEYEYFCSRSAGAGQYGIAKHVASVQTALVTSSTAVCPTPPFTMELRNQNGLLCAYMNGAPDTNISCVADASLTGGYPSIYMADTTAISTASVFSGGNLPPLHYGDSIYGQPGSFTAAQQFSSIGTTTNCKAVGTAANPSVAACAGAAAGTVSCATNASTGTCTVSTTAVTANSEIKLNQRSDTTTGTRLGVTCNTTKDTNSTSPQITAVTAGTSFTFQLGTISTNPECFSYQIVN